MSERKKLADILRNGIDKNRLEQMWESTEAAADFSPLPRGEYDCRLVSGELFNAKTGTPGCKLLFEVAIGEYSGRRLWHDLWLTPPAMPVTKRDLLKLGVTDLKQLERPLPQGILVRAKVVLRKDNDERESNVIRSFDPIGVEPGDAFEPSNAGDTTPSFDLAELDREPTNGQVKDPSNLQQSLLPMDLPDGEEEGPYQGDRR